MKRDAHTGQLDLFPSAPAAPAPSVDWPARVRALLGSKFDSFAWWCREGNRIMCEAVLWKSHGLSREEATHAVSAIREAA